MPTVGSVARSSHPRWLGAPVDGAEHIAVALLLAFLLMGAAGLGLAGVGWFALPQLALLALAVTVGVALLAALPLRGRSRGVVPALAVAAIMVVALESTLPPAQALLTERAQAIVLATGASLARSGRFEQTDTYLSSRVPEARAAVVRPTGDVQPQVFPGFFHPDDGAHIVPKSPMLYAVWTGLGVLLAGPAGGLAVGPVLGAVALALFFLTVRRAFGGRVASLATLLLAFNGVQLWHSTQTTAEVLVQGVMSGGLLAGLLALREPRPLYAVTAGLAFGLLPLVMIEAVVAAVAGAGALLLAVRSQRSLALRPFVLAFAAGTLVSLLHYLTTARLSVTAQIAAGPEYLAIAGVVLLLGGITVARLRGKQRSPSEFSPPGAVVWAVVVLALLLWLALAAGDRHAFAPLAVVYAMWLGSYLSPWDTAVLAVGLAAVLSGGIPRVRRAGPAVLLGTLALVSALFLALYAEYALAQDGEPLLMQATRRLLPTLLPLLAVLEAAALVRWLRALPGGRGPVLLAAAVALTLARLPDVLPLVAHREQAGAVEQLAALAAQMEPDAVVLLDPDAVGSRLAAPLRALHGRTSYVIWDSAEANGLVALRRAIAEDGRRVWYLNTQPRPVEAVLSPAATPDAVYRLHIPELERTTWTRPSAVSKVSHEVRLYRVAPPALP